MTAIRTDKTKARLSRRAVLRCLGLSPAFLPLLDAERAPAANGAFPKRLITVTWTNGVCNNGFYPAGDDPVAGAVLQPLSSLRSKVTVVAGLDYKVMLDGGHRHDGHYSYPVIFTGTYRNTGGKTGQDSTSAGPSIDHVISQSIAQTVNLPIPLISIALVDGSATSYSGADQRNTGETEPQRLFERLFAGGQTPPEQLDGLRKRRASVLDFVAQELSGFGKRMGTEDRAKIEAHLDSIRKLELELDASRVAVNCTAPVAPAASDQYQDKLKAMNALTAIAMRCDLSRVASLVWAGDGGSNPRSWSFIGLGEEYHALAHLGSAAYDRKSQIDTWYYSQIADLAQQLEAIPEGTGTALDNTVIVVANDMAEGSGHNVGGLSFVLVGGCGGALRTGRVVRLGDFATRSGEYWNGDSGVPHNRLLATLCNAMDVPVEGFGQNYSGTLPELHT